MSQHLYPCECCGRHGVAHYRLVPDPTRGWSPSGEVERGYHNVVLCTACFQAGCDSEHDCLAYPGQTTDSSPLAEA